MKTLMKHQALSKRVRIALGTAAVCTLLPLAAQADAQAAPACNALVTVANDLYLAPLAGGAPLAQFTADGLAKEEVALAPDGKTVAYALKANSPVSFLVADTTGRQGVLPVVLPAGREPGTSDPYADAPLTGLSWSSSDVLNVLKHVGLESSRFEFRRVDDEVTKSRHMAAKPAYGWNCSLDSDAHLAACLTQEGDLTVSEGDQSSRTVFSVTGFEGVAPEESLALTSGTSVTTQGIPGFTVQVLGISRSGVDLKVTLPSGNSEESVLASGQYLQVPVADKYKYGFFPTVTNAQSGSVRVDVIKNDSGASVFDAAMTWIPHRQGLLLVRRTSSQAFLYLVTHQGDDGRSWHLAAQAPLGLANSLQAMRFAGPSTLLVEDVTGIFSELPITISQTGHGTESLSVGSPTALPQTLTLALNGASTQGTALDWSCRVPHSGDHDHDD